MLARPTGGDHGPGEIRRQLLDVCPPPRRRRLVTLSLAWQDGEKEGEERGKRRTDAGLRGNMIRFIHDLVETEGLQ